MTNLCYLCTFIKYGIFLSALFPRLKEEREQMIKVIVDSGTDQNQWFKESYDTGFLPLSIILEDHAYVDKVEISQAELHQAMKEGTMPSTSQPSPGQVKEVLEKYYQNGDDVLFISLWKNISGTYQTIKSVIDEYKEGDPNFKAEIVDCRSASIAGSLIAIQALEMAKAGYSFEEVVEQAEWNANHLEIYLTVDDLKWLVKGGRLSKAAGAVGSALNIKPIISVNDEELYSDGMVRGKNRVYQKLVDKIKKDTKDFPEQLYLISHVDEEENAKKVEKIFKEEIPGAQTMIFEFGAVLAAHIGIGGVAVTGLTEKPETYIFPEI